MLGEKRSQSLFAPKASAEKAAATHITTGPDGRKKELPLYFGPDCPVSGNMGQNQHEAGVGEPQPADEPLRHAPADDGTGVEADPTDSVNMAEDLPRRSLNTESAGGYRAHSLFFTPENEGQDFNTVLQDVQEYISGKYSALITEGGDEDAKAQIKRYITKYVQDRRIAVKGYSGDQLVDALYTEMAEFGLLTKYIFGTGIEEINVNSWRDIEVLYANGETVKLEEHFDSPEHAVNVIRRMLHVSGMVLDNASPAVLGHLSKNIRIAVLKTPLVDEDVGVTASIRIVNPQNMQKEDFVKGGTATGPMLDFLAACLRYGVSVCVAGATGSGKTTVAGWLLTTIPDNKRIFTIENGSRELDLVREKDGRVCNSVIHTITRESENAKQNIDQDMLLDMALRYHPDIICVGEMRSAEAYAAQEAARTGHGVLTTIHSNSSQATWRRMVTLCKRKHEMADDKQDQLDLLWQLEEFRKKHEHQAEPSDWAIRMCEAFVARSMGFTDRVQWTELLRQKGETLFTFDWKSGSVSDHVVQWCKENNRNWRYSHLGELQVAHGGEWTKVDYSCVDGRETRVYFPPEAVKEQQLQALAEDPAIHLRDLLTLGLPDHDVYLVHTAEDVGWVPAADLPRLTAQGKEEFSALLDAKVTAIRPGPYGVELVLDGVESQMLVRYDEAIANYSRAENVLGIFM